LPVYCSTQFEPGFNGHTLKAGIKDIPWQLNSATTILRERLWGIPPVGGRFRSNSRTPDAQAQVQRTASAVWVLSIMAMIKIARTAIPMTHTKRIAKNCRAPPMNLANNIISMACTPAGFWK
jgi:hypothetical protein